jgi:hypothetical protein
MLGVMMVVNYSPPGQFRVAHPHMMDSLAIVSSYLVWMELTHRITAGPEVLLKRRHWVSHSSAHMFEAFVAGMPRNPKTYQL